MFSVAITQVHADQGAPGGIQPAGDGERRGLGQHAQPGDAQGQHRPRRAPQDQGSCLGQRSVSFTIFTFFYYNDLFF